MLLHLSTALRPSLPLTNSWTRLTPQTRLLISFLMVFAIALTPIGHWSTWAFYGIGLFLLTVLSRVKLNALVLRMGIEFLFVAMLLLGTVFHSEGSVIWQWGWLKVTTMGLALLGSTASKLFLSLWMLNLLVLTATVPELLQGLKALKVPSLFILIVASMHRYLSVLIHAFATMQQAAISRNLMTHNKWKRLVIGNMIGVLFIRTYDRAERIHHAMLSRGHRASDLHYAFHCRGNKIRDMSALVLTGCFVLMGQALTWL